MQFDPNEKFYDRIANAYDVIAHSSERKACEKGLAALMVTAGERILEIGYGTGHALVALARATGPKGEVCGVDVSTGMHRVTLELLESLELKRNIDLRVGTVPPIDFADESFDAVFLSFTLELFPDVVIDEVVNEISRVLKPGGRCGVVAMATPKNEGEDTPLEKAYVWMHRHFPHIVDCHPINVEATLEKGGLKITHSVQDEIWSMPVAIVVGTKPE